MSIEQLPFSQQFYQLGERFFSEVKPTPLRNPYWIHINRDLADIVGVNKQTFNTTDNLAIFSGHKTIANQPAIAMIYAGHQFGGYSPQLGDGRALMLAQVDTPTGTLDIQLKGAGRTPYSRTGDGRAVLRSSIREYLAGEAMHHLGIATTRALCLIGSEEPVMRETIETGAIVARVARTHIRFGHFEYFHYTDQLDAVKTLADYIIDVFLPQATNAKDKYSQLLQFTVSATAKLIAQWQSVGFAHGVMNTDNMSIIGETLDYGPYGFLDDYQPGFICNHSDYTGRYAFDEQPSIGLWNLSALAHALSSLIDSESIRTILSRYESTLVNEYARLMREKLGLKATLETDHLLCSKILMLMAQDNVDYTLFFRRLCDFKKIQPNEKLSSLFIQKEKYTEWCAEYSERLQQEEESENTESSESERQQRMKRVNPKYIARNHLLQRAIHKAENNKDYSEIDTLYHLLQSPYEEHPGYDEYASAPPAEEKHLEISCSS